MAAPPPPYVSLSQIPYTGFDFGPVGNAMYFAALLAVAAAAAYLLIYFLPGRRTFAFANFTGGNPIRKTLSSNGAGKNSAFQDKDLETVFQSNLTQATVLPEVFTPEVATVASMQSARMTDFIRSGGLPKIESNRLTTDSMIVDRSSGAPRIVIARN